MRRRREWKRGSFLGWDELNLDAQPGAFLHLHGLALLLVGAEKGHVLVGTTLHLGSKALYYAFARSVERKATKATQ